MNLPTPGSQQRSMLEIPGQLAWCCASALLAAGCGFGMPLDVVGVEEDVIEMRDRVGASAAALSFDPELSIVETFDGCALRVNKSAAVTRLGIKELDRTHADIADVIFPDRAQALAALGDAPVIPSMETINGMLKPWNDGLYAAVERIAEVGSHDALVDKRDTLNALLSLMLEAAARNAPGADTAAAHFAAAVAMSGASPQLPAAIQSEADEARLRFSNDLANSTPIGFYTWSDELADVFRRDRFLQTVLGPGSDGIGPAYAVATALASNRQLRERYERVLALYRGLTNPMIDFDPLALLTPTPPTSDGEPQFAATPQDFVRAHPELDAQSPCQARFSWLPASESPERKLISDLYCSGRAPENLLDALIGAIQSGAIDLTPTATSGFYDWQLYALQTLLLPDESSEASHLLLTQKYRDKLVETFKSLLIQTRETHVKQLGTVSVPVSAHFEPRKVDVYPLLPVEPFPTFYLRTARAYEFVHHVLESTLGATALRSATRVFEDGSNTDLSLADELTQKTRLLYGLHLVAAAAIGMHDELSDDERTRFEPAEAERAARAWLEGWREDSDVMRDPRVSVPLVVDRDAGITRNLAVVGVKVLRISADFVNDHQPVVTPVATDNWGQSCALRSYIPFEPYMLVEQTLEYERDVNLPPLTRQALRTVLEGKRTLSSIRQALEEP